MNADPFTRAAIDHALALLTRGEVAEAAGLVVAMNMRTILEDYEVFGAFVSAFVGRADNLDVCERLLDAVDENAVAHKRERVLRHLSLVAMAHGESELLLRVVRRLGQSVPERDEATSVAEALAALMDAPRSLAQRLVCSIAEAWIERRGGEPCAVLSLLRERSGELVAMKPSDKVLRAIHRAAGTTATWGELFLRGLREEGGSTPASPHRFNRN